jgi:hypothetical protein
MFISKDSIDKRGDDSSLSKNNQKPKQNHGYENREEPVFLLGKQKTIKFFDEIHKYLKIALYRSILYLRF